MMKQNSFKRIVFVTCAAVVLALTSLPQAGAQQQAQGTQAAARPAPRGPAVAAFEKRVAEYVKLREGIEEKMPKLSKDATPEQIEAHKTQFQARVRTARAKSAEPGNLFTPDVSNFIRAAIREEFKGQERKELREEVEEAETKNVPLRVNYPYPDSAEQTEMAPTLLLRLPQLPKQVRYRFVRDSLLLIDRENGLILDYMTNAVP
jgi:hypothetical protein